MFQNQLMQEKLTLAGEKENPAPDLEDTMIVDLIRATRKDQKERARRISKM